MVTDWRGFIFVRWGAGDSWRFIKLVVRYVVFHKTLVESVYWLSFVLLLLAAGMAMTLLLKGQDVTVGEKIAEVKQEMREVVRRQNVTERQLAVLVTQNIDLDKRMQHVEDLLKYISYILTVIIFPLLVGGFQRLMTFYGYTVSSRGVKEKGEV